MIVDWLPRPLLRFVIRLYQQKWYHWFASILLGFWDTLFGVIYRIQQYFSPISLWKDWQHRPSPHYPIAMTDDDIPVQPERSDAGGQYIATIVVTRADAASLKAVMPPDAQLNPAYIHYGQHPIIYMFGYTENLHRVWNPLPGINYMEFAVGVPSVGIKRKDGYQFPFFYLPTLYLSRFYPVLMGWMVGYRKHWGWVYGQDKTYELARLGGKRILSASFATGVTQALLMNQARNWQDLLNQPHANPFGPDEYLFLHYHWDWQKALLQPVTAEVEVFEALPGLPPGKYQFPPLDTGAGLDGTATGAMRVCAPFELLPPFSRKALKDYRAMMPLAPAEGTPRDGSAAGEPPPSR